MQTTRVDFKNELGEQHVEMRVFKSVPWGLSRKLSAVGDMSKDDGAKLKFAEIVAIELVVSGVVYDAWTGEPMALPLDEKSVQDAPVEMLLGVLAKFSEMKSEADAATKK